MQLSAEVLLLLLTVLGGWPLCWACNTNREECKRLRNSAMELSTAQRKCSGMRDYLKCVQTDLKDCTDNTHSDQYALNMVRNYCNKAYICSDRLMHCYENYTQTTMQTIASSDNATRGQLCRSLVTPIMTCQDQVTKDCHNQTGLLETVASQQASLKSACSNNVPCLGMVLQCQSRILAITSSATSAVGTGNVTTQSAAANCSTQNSIDYCGEIFLVNRAYKDALACIRANLSTCNDQYSLDNIIATLDNTTTNVCNPNITCMQKVSTCLCHMNSQSATSIMTSICTIYQLFENCLAGLGVECQQNAYVSQQVTSLKASYSQYYTLYCTTERGLCPQAIQCLTQITSAPSTDTSSSAESSLNMSQLCLAASPLLRCLESNSNVCQTGPTNVTFSSIENSLLSLCSEIGPHIQTLSRCSHFAQCMGEFQLMKMGAQTQGSSSTQQAELARHMFVGLTKSSFWCSYLTHSFKCVSESATPCSLSNNFAAETAQQFRDIQGVCYGPPQGATEMPSPGDRVTEPPTKKGNDGEKQGGNGNGSDNTGGASCPYRHHHWVMLAAAGSLLVRISISH